MSPKFKAKLRKLWDRIFFSICIILVIYVFAFDSEPQSDSKDMPIRYVSGGAFQESETVTIIDIIDSDELIIQNRYKQRTILRLLGVRAFDANSSDNRIAYFGQLAYIYLGENVLGKTVRLETLHLKADKKSRLLGHLFLEGNDGAYSVDIGRQMLEDGIAIVYPLHEIGDRRADYENVQVAAKGAEREIWSDPRAQEHVMTLADIWTAK
ncbi:MAG: endonuclease YncB(thermonuclease family) [Rhodothermales bacterium]|jgi:endonuclease YncB( thermonuclease family)